MLKNATRLLLLTALIASVVACGKPATPDQIATQFWVAVEAGDAGKVKKYVSAKDKVTLQSLDDVLAVDGVRFGKIIIDGNNASVDTNVTLAGNRATELPISTHLLRENEHWVVDYERTMQTMVAAGQVAAVINQFKDIGTAIKKGIGQSVNEFQQVLPEIEKELNNMERQIEQSVPKLKSRFEKFSKELEQALNSAPATEAEPEAAPILPPDPSDETPDSEENAENALPRLGKELTQIEQEILKAVPQLKEQIHSFVEQLQEALKLPPEPLDKDPQPGEPIEI